MVSALSGKPIVSPIPMPLAPEQPTPGPALRITELPADSAQRALAEQGLRGLFHAVFAHEIDAATWVWKYHQAPGARAVHMVALDAAGWADPAGHVGCLILPGHQHGRAVWMAHLTDVMVHPRARGGLQADTVYARLMRAMAQHLAALDSPETPILAYGFPGRLPSRLGQRMGLYRPIRSDECQPLWTHHWPERPSRDAVQPRWGPLWPWAQPVQVQRLDPEDAVGLQSAAQAGLRVSRRSPAPHAHVLKDAAYLAWRYLRHPKQVYTLWRVRGRWGRPQGWVVTGGDQGEWIIDAQLPVPSQQGAGWAVVLQALTQATGSGQWRGWRSAGAPFIEAVAPSLIVPGEFRFRELAAGDRGSESAASPARSSAQLGGFYPGDTDVF